MICDPCSKAADAGNRNHGPGVCEQPATCPCFHGRFLEQDPEDPDVPQYLDALPTDHPDRLAYEARVRRKIER